MLPKILSGAALFLAITGLIIKIVAISSPNFVDVHFINDIDDIDDDNIIAGVGVYNSIYDPAQNADTFAIVAEEGLPTDRIESNTLEFVLLFPAQENFVSLLLPIGRADAVNLDAALNSGMAAQGLIQPGIDAVEAVEFDNCQGYLGDIIPASIVYFNTLEDELLPVAVSAITGLIAEGLNNPPGMSGLQDLQDGIHAAASAAAGIGLNVLQGAIIASAGLDNANCGNLVMGVAVNTAAVLNAAARTCITDGTNAVVAAQNLSTLTTIVANSFSGIAGLLPDNTPLSDYFAAAQGSWAFNQSEGGGALIGLPEFIAPLGNVCAADGGVFGCTTKLEFLQVLVTLLNDNIDENDMSEANMQLIAARGAIGAYLFFISGGGYPLTSTFLDVAAQDSSVAESVFPANFGDAYQPCEIINLFTAVVNSTAILGDAATCNEFRIFLAALPNLLALQANPLEPTVRALAETYAACDVVGGGLIGGVCAEIVFGPGLVAAAFSVNTTDNLNVAGDIISACEDDVEDNEAVATAQILLGFSVAFNIITVILVIVSFFVLPKVVGPIGAFFAVLGSVFIIGGLLVVRGAPVYEGVGEEPNGEDFEPIFVEGFVALLALVDAALFFLAAILLVASAITSCVQGDGDADDEEKKEVANMEDKL